MRFAALLVAVFLVTPIVHAETGAELMARGRPVPAKVTCFAPGPNDNIEGPWATSRPRPAGACTDEFGNSSIPMTLDAVRLGKCKYVTLAANPSYYGAYLYIGTVTYRSPIPAADGLSREYILNDVIGYVHDTGPAFRSPNCERFNTCHDIDKKYDVAVGDFRGWAGPNASQFVDPQPFCRNRLTTFYHIGGAPLNPPQVFARDTGAPGNPIVPGNPLGTNYGPFGLGTQPYVPQSAMNGLGARGAQSAFGAPGAVGSQGSSPFSPYTPTSGTPIDPTTGQPVQPPFISERNAATLIVGHTQVQKGSRVMVAWSSVGMKSDDVCRLYSDVGRGAVLAGSGNNGALLLRIPVDAAEEVKLQLTCSPQTGTGVERSATIRTM